MIVLHTPGLSGRSSKQFFWPEQHSSEVNKRPSGYVGFPVFTSGTTGQYLNDKGVDPNT